MGSVNPEEKIISAVAKAIRSEWKWIHHPSIPGLRALNAQFFHTDQRTTVARLRGMRSLIFSLLAYASFPFSTDTMHHVEAAIDRTVQRIEGLEFRPPQEGSNVQAVRKVSKKQPKEQIFREVSGA